MYGLISIKRVLKTGFWLQYSCIRCYQLVSSVHNLQIYSYNICKYACLPYNRNIYNARLQNIAAAKTKKLVKSHIL